MRAPMRPEFERVRGTGQWHGGPIASVIDTVGDYRAGHAARPRLPTINFRVDYLRPAIKTALIVTARVRRNGRSVGVVDVDSGEREGGARRGRPRLLRDRSRLTNGWDARSARSDA